MINYGKDINHDLWEIHQPCFLMINHVCTWLTIVRCGCPWLTIWSIIKVDVETYSLKCDVRQCWSRYNEEFFFITFSISSCYIIILIVVNIKFNGINKINTNGKMNYYIK